MRQVNQRSKSNRAFSEGAAVEDFSRKLLAVFRHEMVLLSEQILVTDDLDQVSNGSVSVRIFHKLDPEYSKHISWISFKVIPNARQIFGSLKIFIIFLSLRTQK